MQNKIIDLGILNVFLGSNLCDHIEKLIRLFRFTEDVRTYEFSHEEASAHFQRIFNHKKSDLIIDASFLSEENYTDMRKGVVAEIRGGWGSEKGDILRINKISTVESVLYEYDPCRASVFYSQYQHGLFLQTIATEPK